MGDQFTPEARAELLAMYTGMALQGILASAKPIGLTGSLGVEAVRIAEATVFALEQYHVRNAKGQTPSEVPRGLTQ